MKHGSTHKTTKGYPRCTAGPLRHQYLHRIVAAALIGRALTKDEEVHHRDGDRRNFWYSNLYILGHADHGWVSAKQAYFMRTRDEALKREWDDFMSERAEEQSVEIASARDSGIPWAGQLDGALQDAWQSRG